MQRTAIIAYVLGALVVVLGAGLGYGYYQYRLTSDALVSSQADAATLSEALTREQADAEALRDALDAEKARNDAFEDQINNISGTVGKLDKLSRMDPELLQKYSKIYFLNENYVPSELSEIDPVLRFQRDRDEYVHAQVLPHLEDLIEDAQDDGVELLVASAYRSFDRQGSLKASYVVRYGTGANAFSAEQGYSEHQLGTTVDFTTEAVGGMFVGFDQSEAYEWLSDNAYKYGFILSYPKGNTYYQYEPWHWRFVGRDLARDLHNDEKNFYDLDQREIDSYLISLFD